MKRGIVVAVVGLVALAGGCASPAHVVNYNSAEGTGTVGIPNNSNVWPFYYHREALALIEKQVGPNYKIVSEGEVVTGQSTVNNQQTNTDQTANARNPNQSGERQTVSGSTTQQNITEYRISFVRLPGPPAGRPTGVTPASGVVPAGGFVPAGGPAAGVVPSVLPVPNGPTGRWPNGSTSYFVPSTQAPRGADCAH